MAKNPNPNYVSNKLFLDQSGLQALIAKIAGLKTDFDNQITDVTTDLSDLIEMVNKVFGWNEEKDNVIITDDPNNPLKQIKDAVDALRNELGEEGANGETVYERLKALEDGLAAIDVESLNALIASAFVNVLDPKYDEASQTVTIGFENLNKEVTNAVIDMTPFIVHGMLDDVKLAVVAADADPNATLADGTEIPVTVPGGLKKGKYLVFTFKVQHDDSSNGTHGSEETEKVIWVNVNDLFTDYIFDTTDDNDYIKATFTEDPSNSYNAAQKWTLTVVPGDAQVKVNDLVEGKALDGKTGTSTYKGIVELNDALDKAVNDLNDLTETVNALDETVNGEGGLVERVEALEKWKEGVDDNLLELNNWTESNTIHIDFINDYFDYTVYGQGTKPEPGDDKYKD